ncbi:MAG: 3-deoxy-8-phosphooctulonate synthase [Saprospiraceae bacterium]|nr:3-deoxy-8-phosphooctulonate synthase [Saprospiraceae bacterium]
MINENWFNHNFFLIAGPCAVESKDLVQEVAGQVKEWCEELQIPYIFKASYEKANRSRLDSFTTIGRGKAMEALKSVKSNFGIPLTTDIHKDDEAEMAAEVVDVLQIPAFLCRQTSLLTAAAKTGKIVNIKKGQFMSPDAMKFAVEKVKESGNENVWLTERGTTFGYQDLVVDFRGIPVMQDISRKVVLDCTHSLQMPNQSGGVTGGRPKFISLMARAGIAAGVDGLFIETHPRPEKALSDGANMLRLDLLYDLLRQLTAIRAVEVNS